MWPSSQLDPTSPHRAGQRSGSIEATITGFNFKDLAYLKYLLQVLLKKRHIHEVDSDSGLLIGPICLCLHGLRPILSRLLTANARLHKWLIECLGLVLHKQLTVLAILRLQLHHLSLLVLGWPPFEVGCQLWLARRLYVINENLERMVTRFSEPDLSGFWGVCSLSVDWGWSSWFPSSPEVPRLC